MLYVNALASFLNEYNTKATKTDPVLEYKDTLGGGGQYDYRLEYDGRLQLRRRQRRRRVAVAVLAGGQERRVRDEPGRAELPTDDYNVFDVFASYTFNERFQLRAGIDNLLTTDPAIVGAVRAGPTTLADSNSASTLAGYYDTLGRRYYVGLKMDF